MVYQQEVQFIQEPKYFVHLRLTALGNEKSASIAKKIHLHFTKIYFARYDIQTKTSKSIEFLLKW